MGCTRTPPEGLKRLKGPSVLVTGMLLNSDDVTVSSEPITGSGQNASSWSSSATAGREAYF